MVNNLVAGSLEWARFRDWLTGALGFIKDWTIIAAHSEIVLSPDRAFAERRSATSFLCPNTKKALSQVLAEPLSGISETRESIWVNATGRRPKIAGNRLPNGWKTIVTRREAYGETYPECWRLSPELEEYFNLRMTRPGIFVDPESGDEVIKAPYRVAEGPVPVRTDYLQEFLAAWNKVLIQQFDIKRKWSAPVPGLPEHEGSDHEPNRTRTGVYILEIRNSSTNEYLRDSWLHAKDVVPPFQRSGMVGRHRKRALPKNRSLKFIVRRDAGGSLISRKPDPEDFTTAVFFRPEVLRRYYDNPSRYHVGFSAPGMGGVGQIDSWDMSIGRNSEGFIVAWLADLVKQRLPEEELRHWQAHNVPPQGGMAVDFFDAEMRCKPSQTPSLESRLRDCRYHIREFFRCRGKEIFRPYIGPDVHAEEILRIPLFNEHSEFRDCITILSRIFVESLNEDLFKSELPKALTLDANGSALRSIKLLANWLRHVPRLEEQVVGRVKHALDDVQTARSKAGVAHRFSDSEYRRFLKRRSLPEEVTGAQLFCSLAQPLADALEDVCVALGVGPELWWRKKRADDGEQ